MKIVITACSHNFMDKCLTLISSIHKTSLDVIDMIIIYNLGLSEEDINNLKTIKKVNVRNFEDINTKQLGNKIDIDRYYRKPYFYAWKSCCIYDAILNFGERVIYLDCGIICLKSLEHIYDIIETNDIFLVGDYHKNYNWTIDSCFDILGATNEEINDTQLCGGIQGHKRDGKYMKLLYRYFKYSQIQKCIEGRKYYDIDVFNKTGNKVIGHRHDQSILSILASRYKCPRQDLFIYGEYRSLEECHTTICNSYLYVHRGMYYNISGIIYKNDIIS